MQWLLPLLVSVLLLLCDCAVAFNGAVASDVAADVAAVHRFAAADIVANVAAANALSLL